MVQNWREQSPREDKAYEAHAPCCARVAELLLNYSCLIHLLASDANKVHLHTTWYTVHVVVLTVFSFRAQYPCLVVLPIYFIF